MPNAKKRYAIRNKAKKVLDKLFENRDNLLFIHYSCESFYKIEDGKSPRITSIAIKEFKTNQCHSFSINLIAEEKKIPFEKISENYDILEFEMLKRFYVFLSSHKHFWWIHWNMRNTNYGFSAIEHRFRILGGETEDIESSNLYDLAALLIDLYGQNYSKHPRLESIVKFNGISTMHFLSGKEEAEAYDASDFYKLHLSTLRKVDIFLNLLNRVFSNSLKIQSGWKVSHGSLIAYVYETVTENILVALTLIMIGFLSGIASILSLFSNVGGK